jgi:hypothetical protein
MSDTIPAFNCTIPALQYLFFYGLNPAKARHDGALPCEVSFPEEMLIFAAVAVIVVFILFEHVHGRISDMKREVNFLKAHKMDVPPPAHECRCDDCGEPLKKTVNVN